MYGDIDRLLMYHPAFGLEVGSPKNLETFFLF